MSAGREVPGAPTQVPGWARAIGRALVHGVWDTQVVGADRVPADGPLLIAANHVSLADGPLLVGAAPRPLHVLVKQEMFHGPVGRVLRGAGQIPVDRGMGRPALQSALAVLRRGGAVGIFPEGNRGRGSVEDARAGIAWLAVHSGAPVVPAAILGTRRTGEPLGHLPGLRRRLVVEFGEPLDLAADGVSRRESVALGAQRVRTALAALVAGTSARTGITLPGDDVRAPSA
ncbi:lysophospholipid acyltransferase family protein [Cellulomonas shaoxiangyii]|uniref:1-acyl-sn-glycerol-3-phosphate acyltransferase n=1 Tax=Cellulomonas shaoxiangyii TaxID=2566013 RepID=A0A4P7SJ60_9CELL|nr:lysophospholipid acyltransferase family protein [Cellulomonas shaoxiangyii]QCB93527.1 1-acyl-sn-glycerol-3-phosphate acyltransferase [Cellulomonas shaoxiangyii]TGY86849.1 1-acyl-sn-glycerol-3-phosphate acyltransferase [Cellulomonas shaoxiangyii]